MSVCVCVCVCQAFTLDRETTPAIRLHSLPESCRKNGIASKVPSAVASCLASSFFFVSLSKSMWGWVFFLRSAGVYFHTVVSTFTFHLGSFAGCSRSCPSHVFPIPAFNRWKVVLARRVLGLRPGANDRKLSDCCWTGNEPSCFLWRYAAVAVISGACCSAGEKVFCFPSPLRCLAFYLLWAVGCICIMPWTKMVVRSWRVV